MTDKTIEVHQLTHTYFTNEKEIKALQSISFDVKKDEFVVIIGPSGCGKSTILSCIAGLIRPTSGSIRINGSLLNGPSRKIGYMLQKDGLLEWRTVEENLMLGLEIRHEKTDSNKLLAYSLLEQMGLINNAKDYPSQLSGGMRQRVALARTLAINPEILLLDEPFSALDIQNKIHLEELLLRFTQGKSAILVTHDLEEALAVGDTILVLEGSPGRIKRTISVPSELRASSPFEARNHPAFRSLFKTLWKEVKSS